METLLDLINKNEILEAVKLIASSKELQQKAMEINELFIDSEINSSTITVYSDKVIGYEGNGHFTLDEDDYESRHIEIKF